MPDMTELKERRDFRKAVLSNLRVAYINLVRGGVKSYMIDDRQLTRLDLPELKKEIKELEEIGLAAPQVTYIMNELRKSGFPVNTEAMTIEEAAKDIARVLRLPS